MSAVTATRLEGYSAQLASASRQQKQEMLRDLAGEVVGGTFFSEMLKIARSNPLKGKYGHGGRGEDIFRSQLDMHFAQEAGRSMRNELTEAIYRRFAEKV